MALLGKQCWNLLTNPGALVSRLLKARYYPHCSLFEADRKGGSSYTWSSLWEAKESMKPGVRWVLGDGNSISIYGDKWLRGKPNFCVETGYNTAMTRDVKVSEFFLRNCKAWNEDKIRNTFSSVDYTRSSYSTE